MAGKHQAFAHPHGHQRGSARKDRRAQRTALLRAQLNRQPMGPFLVRAAVTGFALWGVTKFVVGLRFVGGHNDVQRIAIIFAVAVLFGLVIAIIKPIVQFLSIPLYILTLGLFHFVVNAFML